MRERSAVVVIGGVLLAAAGCKPLESSDGTPGEQGRVAFNYQRSCFFGCPLEQPLLVGTRERIELSDAGDVEQLQVAASDPAIAEFAVERECFCQRRDDEHDRVEITQDASCSGIREKHCDNTVLVQALAAGVTDLELREGDRLIDRVAVEAATAARARFVGTLKDRLGAIEGSQFELAAGESMQLEIELFDGEGRKLLAPEGVSWQMDDDAVAIVSAFLYGSGAQVSAGLSVVVEAKAEGSTSLAVDVPGLRAEVELSVTP
jgi:hypothetical protein